MTEQKKKVLTSPSFAMFAPYKQTILSFLVVTVLIVALIIAVQLLMVIR